MNHNILSATIALTVGMPLFFFNFHKPWQLMLYIIVWAIVVLLFLRELFAEEKGALGN